MELLSKGVQPGGDCDTFSGESIAPSLTMSETPIFPEFSAIGGKRLAAGLSLHRDCRNDAVHHPAALRPPREAKPRRIPLRGPSDRPEGVTDHGPEFGWKFT